jgi:repressor LexA
MPHFTDSNVPALSPKQLEVLEFIRAFIREHHSPPTRGEIAEGLGLKNRQGIDQHLRALETKGAIELIAGISRGIRLREPALQPRSEEPDDHTLPLLGRIAAGSPILATGNVEERLHVDPNLFKPRADFLLRVRGDSMRDADILDRDLLAVHRTNQVRNGQIVVARLGEEATVKYYRRQGSTVRLEPANPDFKPIEVDLHSKELPIDGLAVGVVRRELARIR